MKGIKRMKAVRKLNDGDWYQKERRKYQIFLAMILLITGTMIGIVYMQYQRKVPDTICIKSGSVQELDYHVPASGEIIGARNIPVSLAQKVTFNAGDALQTYQMKLKLFGMIPFKDVNIQVIQDRQVIPVGKPIGIYVKTKGILVISVGTFEGTDGLQKAPSKYILQEGDYLLAMDGKEVNQKKEIMEYVSESQGKNVMFTVKRKDDIFDVTIKPEQMTNGAYKMGVWLRDSAQGIGTMTFVDQNRYFGALGHGINDTDTSELMELSNGLLYQTDIVAIRKGERGKPGELTGFIEYVPERILGMITTNNGNGIYGMISEKMQSEITGTPMEIGLKQDVKIGSAKIMCTIDEEPECFDVEITNIQYDHENINRQMSIKVTDQRLLEVTGGIVQGLSGAPIIQNDKLIGAVTHVLVNDPAKGYGIFIESMLEQE